MSHYGRIRLVGFSNTPTLYRMILPQRGDVYVKCGADLLLNGLETDLRAEARCPVCGNVTRFNVDKKRIEDLAPKDPTLHVVEFEVEPGHLRVECESTHIFDKKNCLTKWLSTYAGKQGLVVSLLEYMSSLNHRPPRKASPASVR
ncbi:MAG TPA: organomercurial lyase [Candidatus Bathyarchaeia archaeon]|nr:organomercurial lyase [Candidatus Bathyarchaeia archaeon]